MFRYHKSGQKTAQTVNDGVLTLTILDGVAEGDQIVASDIGIEGTITIQGLRKTYEIPFEDVYSAFDFNVPRSLKTLADQLSSRQFLRSLVDEILDMPDYGRLVNPQITKMDLKVYNTYGG